MKKRILWLDSLRGVAALMVAIMHLWEVMKTKYPIPTHSRWGRIVDLIISDCLNFGKVGIVVFFIISGYVIPFSLKKSSIKKFVVNRFFRLYPAYWFSILLFIVLIGIPPIFLLMSNITMFQKFIGRQDLVGVYWTLQIELIFYMICILLKWKNILFNIKFISISFFVLLFLALLASVVRFQLNLKLPIALFLGLALMLFGMLLRLYNEKQETEQQKMFFYIKELYWFVLFLIPICFLAYNKDYGFHETWYKYLISYTIGLILFYLFSQTAFSGKIWSYIGNISYSLYLIHPVVGLLYLGKLNTKYHFSFVQFGIYYFILIFITASFCYYLIEKNMIALGKRATKNL